jgi:hypothetical protein
MYCIFLLFITSARCGEKPAEENNNSNTDLYYVQIVFPREDFIGGLPTPSAFPSVIPSRQEHFIVELMKLKKLEVGKPKDCYTILAELIDFNGNPQKRQLRTFSTEFDYKFQIMIVNSNGHYFPSCEVIYPDDFEGGRGIGSSMNGLEPSHVTPLFNVRPPKYGFQKRNSENYLYGKTRVTIYNKEIKDGIICIDIKKYHLEKPFSQNTKNYEFLDNVMTVIKEHNARLLYYEKQEWSKPDDWIWSKMKRYDYEGNLMYHCDRMDNLPDKFVFPNDIKLPQKR